MIVEVVMGLEMIDIKHQQRQRLLGTGAAPPFARCFKIERPAIGNSGQGIRRDQRFEVLVDHCKLLVGNFQARDKVGLLLILQQQAHGPAVQEFRQPQRGDDM